MNPLRKLLLPVAFTCLALFGTANAQFFLGTVGSTLISSEGVVFFTGIQGGSYDLGGGFGVRGGLEVFPVQVNGGVIFQVEATGLYVTGEGIKFYTGPSLGLLSAGGGAAPFAGLAVGVDFDSETVISYFIEAQPRYYFGGAAGVLIRSGLNFHIGL